MTFHVLARVTLRPSILDPEGKAVTHALGDLGLGAVSGVRIGKHIEMTVEADSAAEARRVATEACEKLLANPVMEDFAVEAVDAVQAA